MTNSIRVAIVQRPPVTLDRTATMKRVLEGMDDAAGDGARLVVFPETYLPGYPEYIWRLRPGTRTTTTSPARSTLVCWRML